MKYSTPKSVLSKPAFEISILQFGLPIIVFFMPLIFSRNVFLTFNLPQVTFFRSAVVLLASLFLIFCARKKIFPFFRNLSKSTTILFLFLFTFVSLLAMIFSKAPVVSFFGGYFREQGFLTQLHYVLFFLLIIFAFDLATGKERDKFFRRFLVATSLSGTLVALYGILQKIGFDPFFSDFEKAFLFGRIFSTLGQPNLLGTWLLFPIAASFTLTLQSNEKFFRWIGFLGLSLQIIALTLTLSRAAWLGFFVFLFVYLLVSLLKASKKKLAYIFLVITALIFIGLAGLQTLRNTEISKNPFVSRFLLQGESLRSIESRLFLWQGAIKVFAESPFLGHGQETFSFVFPRHQSEKLLELEEYFGLADRAHNVIFDLLVTTGLFGALAFLFFIISAVFHSIRANKNIPLTAGVIGFIASDLLGFQLPIHSVFLYLFVALLVVSNFKKNPGMLQKISFPFSLQPVALFLIALLLLPTIYFWNIKPLQADFAYQKGSLEKAFRKKPHESFYALAYGKSLLELAGPASLRSAVEEAVAVSKSILLLSPFDREAFVLLGKAYAELGDTKLADEIFLEGIRLSPRSPVTLKPWADALFYQKRYEEAKKVYEYLLEISPKYWQWPRKSLVERTYYERERYRIFFKDNPDFLDILRNTSVIYKTLGDQRKANFYTKTLSDIADLKEMP